MTARGEALRYIVEIDGVSVGSLEIGESDEFVISLGQHVCRIVYSVGKGSSLPVQFSISQGQCICFECGPYSITIRELFRKPFNFHRPTIDLHQIMCKF